MNYFRLLAKLSVFTLLIVSGPMAYVIGSSSNTQIPNISLDAENKEWTILIYMCGDNNLEYFALDDLNELEAGGGSNADVNVVVMVDRSDLEYETPDYANDWSETRYYVIEGDAAPTTFTSPVNQSLGELNMGDPNTLENFVDWGLTNFPANNTALILWDHGGGIDGVCWDDTDDDFLTIDEVDDALDGYYFDLIAFDACIMGHIEILYELQDNCGILVSSLLNIPGDGYPYDTILTNLKATPSQTAADWASFICTAYVASYSIYSVDVTLSAYNLTALAGFDSLMNAYVTELSTALPTYLSSIYAARLLTRESYIPDFLCEFYEFVDETRSITAGLATAGGNLITMLDDVLISTESSLISDPYGLWAFLPSMPYNYINDFYIYSNQSIVNSYINYYYDFEFVADTTWDNFLHDWKIALDSYISEVSVSTSYSSTLVYGDYKFIQADLTDPGAGKAYMATLTMNDGDGDDFDLYAFNEEYFLGMSGGVYTAGQAEGSIPEMLFIPVNDFTTVIFVVYSYSGSGTYTLSLEVIDYEDDSYEENDFIFDAAPIAVDSAYSLIAYDDDYFVIELNAGDTVEITLDLQTSLVDLDLILLDSSGEIIDVSESYDSDEFISHIATYTGEYYIWVRYFDGDLGTSYTLTVMSSGGVSITDINVSPYEPQIGEAVTITCIVTGPDPVVLVVLSYTYDGDTWTNVTMNDNGNDEYSAIIPGNDDEDYVYFKIYAKDDQNNWDISSEESIYYESTAFSSFPWALIPVLLVALAFTNKRFIKKFRK